MNNNSLARDGKTECPLSANEIDVIRERYHGWEKASAKTLAAVFGVSVQRIVAVAGRKGA